MSPDKLATLMEHWSQNESQFSANSYRGTGSEDDTVHLTGNGRVTLVAGHAVNHLREDNVKRAEKFTGSLALALAQHLGQNALAVTGEPSIDPNHSKGSSGRFREEILEKLRERAFVVDIHGMKDSHGPDINIGIGPAPSERVAGFAATLSTAAEMFGLSCVIGKPFAATSPGTLTAFLQSQGVDACQVEIAARRRDPSDNPEMAKNLAATLVSALNPAP